MAHIPANVKGHTNRFRGWLTDRWESAESWLNCHPKTTTYIILFLTLNYFFDFIRIIFG